MPAHAAEGRPGIYLDASATTPLADAAALAMAEAQRVAWANPSSLHGFGLEAADRLESSRQSIASAVGAQPDQLLFTSGATEAIHTALLGLAAGQPPGRLLVSAVEHPAVLAAAQQLVRHGWTLELLSVDPVGRIDLQGLQDALRRPAGLVSVIWGQSEVGTLQPLAEIAACCRSAGVPLHVDAVQVVGHAPVDLACLGATALSFTAHKLMGPRGIGALALAPDVRLTPLIPGSQEGGRRGGTEAVVLAAGFAAALEEACARLTQHGGQDPISALRDPLLADLLNLPGVQPTGCLRQRLPHHISLRVSSREGAPLPARRLVEALWRRGYAVSSGSACAGGRDGGSAVLRAMGLGKEESRSGVRISLGPWLQPTDLEGVPVAFAQAIETVALGSRH